SSGNVVIFFNPVFNFLLVRFIYDLLLHLALNIVPHFSLFLNHPPTPEFYTLSLHDALPISNRGNDQFLGSAQGRNGRWGLGADRDRKSTRLNSSHVEISYAVFCLKKKSNRNVRVPITLTIFRSCCPVPCHY